LNIEDADVQSKNETEGTQKVQTEAAVPVTYNQSVDKKQGETSAKADQEGNSAEASSSSGESGQEGQDDDPVPVASTLFHHWNPTSWDGKGSSIVLCPNDHMDQCWLNGEKLTKHGNTDTDNRQIWTDYDTPGLFGEVICRKGNKAVKFKVTNTTKIEYGECG
jgi:hypothetical protein